MPIRTYPAAYECRYYAEYKIADVYALGVSERKLPAWITDGMRERLHSQPAIESLYKNSKIGHVIDWGFTSYDKWKY